MAKRKAIQPAELTEAQQQAQKEAQVLASRIHDLLVGRTTTEPVAGMEFRTLRLSIHQDAVVICLDGLASKPVVTVGPDLLRELDRVLDALSLVKPAWLIKTVVFTSSKPIAGADINEIRRLQKQGDPAKIFAAPEFGTATLSKLRRFNSIGVINGDTKGGGAEGMLWCRQRIASTVSPLLSPLGASLSLPEPRLGVPTGFGGIELVMRLMKPLDAIAFLCGAQTLQAQDAHRKGLINQLIPVDSLDGLIAAAIAIGKGEDWHKAIAGYAPPPEDEPWEDDGEEAQDWARAEEAVDSEKPKEKKATLPERLAAAALSLRAPDGDGLVARRLRKVLARVHRPFARAIVAQVDKKATGYESFSAVARLALRSLDQPLPIALRNESIEFTRLAAGRPAKHQVEAFLARSALKKLAGKAKSGPLEEIGVIGAGFMGREIAFEAAFAKVTQRVVIFDSSTQGLALAVAEIRKLFAERVADGKILPGQARKAMKKVVVAENLSDLADCDAVVEAVFEKPTVKLDCLRNLEAALKAYRTKKTPCMILSNTSSLSLEMLKDALEDQEHFVGFHGFSPFSKMLGVEVGLTSKTAPEAVATAIALATAMGKLAFPCQDYPGFLVNAILAPQMIIAAWLLQFGSSPLAIDKAMMNLGWPMGPCKLMDFVGLDVAMHVATSLLEAGLAADPDLGRRFMLPDDCVLAKLVSLLGANGKPNMLGKKTGQGIYLWDGDKPLIDKKTHKPVINPKLKELLPVDAKGESILGKRELDEHTLQVWLKGAMESEYLRVVQAGAAPFSWVIDAAMIYCTGWPASMGGPGGDINDQGPRVFRDLMDDIARSGPETWRLFYRPCALLEKHAASGLRIGDQLPSE